MIIWNKVGQDRNWKLYTIKFERRAGGPGVPLTRKEAERGFGKGEEKPHRLLFKETPESKNFT